MKTGVIFSIVFLCSSLVVYSGVCRCGNYQVGITEFVTHENDLCCNGTIAEGISASQTYYEYVDGAWRVSGVKEIDPFDAQSICCPPSPA